MYKEPLDVSEKKLRKRPANFRSNVVRRIPSPVEWEKQRKANLHKKILVKGDFLMNKCFNDLKDGLQNTVEQKRKTMENLVQRQLQKEKANIQSESKKKLLQFTEETQIKFNKDLATATADTRNGCEERRKQYLMEVKRLTSADFQESILEQKKHLGKKFERFKIQNLADFKNYYRQLIDCYQQTNEKQLADMKQKHDENYENLKKSLIKKYNRDLALAKINYQRILSSKQSQPPPELPVINDDETNRKELESLIQQRTKKLNDLNRDSRQLMFYKMKIKSILNNYGKIVTMMVPQPSDVHYVLDKKMMIEKYLGRPTKNELKQLSIPEDE
ncbi:Hypothetical protein CINCED_3A015155 [Cinara cedri]|uniref:Uncharacterized protein n=1 Tax=Cinara cedri TaxID=506608 RepID=A0A5E4MTK3_9HEMI|nr:Hypothetical protein CINCED_3A015155 [Cinara cedri]